MDASWNQIVSDVVGSYDRLGGLNNRDVHNLPSKRTVGLQAFAQSPMCSSIAVNQSIDTGGFADAERSADHPVVIVNFLPPLDGHEKGGCALLPKRMLVMET